MSNLLKVFTPSPEQAIFLDWVANGEGNCVLEAVAGAGKTSTLVEAIRLMKGGVFLGAYNKKMAEELKARLAEMGYSAFAGAESKEAATFHSAGFKALRKTNKNIKVDNDKVHDIVKAMFANRVAEAGEAAAVAKLVGLAKQTGFYVRGLVETVKPAYWVELINRYDVADSLSDDYDIGQLVSLAEQALAASNAQLDTVDFDDMCYLPLFLNLKFWQYDWVLIDEAQDTNAVRRMLARKMLRYNGRLVAVGDRHQAIFGFTGADNKSLDIIREAFAATTMMLSVSWRCPTSVVGVAREYVGHINAAPTANEGAVSAMSYSEMLASVAPGQAVLCRTNAPLVELCFRLIREGKAAKIEGRDVGAGLVALVGRWKVKGLDAFETKLVTFDKRERAKLSGLKDADAKIERHEDKIATIMVLLERAREQGLQTVAEMQAMVSGMFEDCGSNNASIITLSSVHKSKGLEWGVVHLLGRGEIMPSKRAVQEWQIDQETNLCYVAVTRAQERLIDVSMPTEADRAGKKKKQEVAA